MTDFALPDDPTERRRVLREWASAKEPLPVGGEELRAWARAELAAEPGGASRSVTGPRSRSGRARGRR